MTLWNLRASSTHKVKLPVLYSECLSSFLMHLFGAILFSHLGQKLLGGDSGVLSSEVSSKLGCSRVYCKGQFTACGGGL